MEDAGRGWRYIVPSPRPRRILDIDLIESLADEGIAVIAAGGGGIPVIHRADRSHQGVAAVIDKDLTSALLANQLGVETMMILTAVSKVSINFGKKNQKSLDRVAASDLRGYQSEGHFGKGSMGPKIEAALSFIAGGGRRAIIAHLEEALPALQGKTGTHVVAG